MNKKIGIVGAGIAGLTAAISLKRLGYQVVLYESSPEIKGIGAGFGLASNAMRAFSDLKLEKGIIPLGTLLNESRICDSMGKIISVADTSLVKNLKHPSLAIHRKDLHHYLLNQLPENSVFTHKQIINLEHNKTEVKLFFKDNTQDTCDYLIGADGVGSTVRQLLIPNSKPRYSGYTCWRAVIDNPDLKIKENTEVWGKQGRFGFVSLIDNKIYWYCCINAAPKDTFIRQMKTEALFERFKNYLHPIGEIIKNTTDEQLIQNDIVDIKPLSEFAFGRILLVGDAAHATTPNMGQGACMAVEDIAVLTSEVQKTDNIETAFDNFEKKRVNRTRYITNTSSVIGKIAQLENPVLCRIRNFIFRNLPKSFVKKQMKQILAYDFYK